ncbi:hypothetical protein WH50_09105 [Pokkaliibacter plantistimulans]|uniref:Uncharacterized protein n=1 Tax=Pokkaliibacter plantistimulans TaxID=1635171 RepID=A0ABX5LY52_9GAMM|nr:hypothetical protein WH50_09105 [Pokkaliibacter plantistimulans]
MQPGLRIIHPKEQPFAITGKMHDTCSLRSDARATCETRIKAADEVTNARHMPGYPTDAYRGFAISGAATD